MKIAVDYVTLRLNEKFGWREFSNWIEQERIDESTGQVLPPIIQAHQFRVKTMLDKTVVVSFYSGAEPEAIKLSRKWNLPVTRVDICIDEEFEDDIECEGQYKTHVDNIHAWIEMQSFQPSYYNFEGKATSKNGDYGFVLFSRQSVKQLRMYAKRQDDGSKAKTLRYEWQLHGDLAKEVWPLVTTRYPFNRETLFDLHQNITAKFLEDDFFELGSYNKQEVTFTKKPNEDNGFEQWCLITIPKALFRHFKTTGIDYTPQIQEEFVKMLQIDAENQGQKVKTKEQAAIAATYHKLGEKVKNAGL